VYILSVPCYESCSVYATNPGLCMLRVLHGCYESCMPCHIVYACYGAISHSMCMVKSYFKFMCASWQALIFESFYDFFPRLLLYPPGLFGPFPSRTPALPGHDSQHVPHSRKLHIVCSMAYPYVSRTSNRH
jgi:hypothetical protein